MQQGEPGGGGNTAVKRAGHVASGSLGGDTGRCHRPKTWVQPVGPRAEPQSE